MLPSPGEGDAAHTRMEATVHFKMTGFLALVILAAALSAAVAGDSPFGQFDGHGDIGSPRLPGSAAYNAVSQEYTLTSAGLNMWAARDEFHFAWKRMTGDFILQARVELIGTGVDRHRKLGWIVRSTLDADSPYADAAVHGDGLTSLQYRRTKGAATEEMKSAIEGADVVQLEILDLASGHRQVMHSAADPVEAPNWTKDGRALLYNTSGRGEGRGRLFRFDLATRQPALVDTGFATRNNNDHVLSFDGTMLAISDQSQGDGKSTVYTVPVEGGTPKRITTLAPSYMHGWSPDGKFLVYTGGRSDEYDIYRIPADGSGPEIKLTDAKGLDDGPEYSPDGRQVYFNSVRSGTMQIWRMKADGTDPQQVTNDEYNNWFPHVSPDGQWIAFLSFARDVSPSDHPYYKRVYLRLLPAGSGFPRVIAYVYGGQGTINVPSWSPDGRMLAFVSNGGLP